MWLLAVVRAFVCAGAWRVTGLRAAGHVLVRALGSKDENVRTVAGMFLVKAGAKAEPLLQEALEKRENLPLVLSILADIGARKFEPEIRQFLADSDPQVAKAAEEALRVLAAHH